jgi:predicted negative regulator of RcsB-dependent stress response
MAEKNTNQASSVMDESSKANEAFFLKYKYPIIGCFVALLVVAGCCIWYNGYKADCNEKASTAMAKAQENFMNGNYELALNGDSTGVAGFLKVASEYSSTDAGNLANLYAGLCYANLDQWENAAQSIEKFDASDDQMISPAALGALGNVYAHLNQLDKAVNTLIKAAEKADNNSLSPTFLLQAGQILEKQEKKGEALKLYKQIKEKYFYSVIVSQNIIDEYIERVSE